MPNPSQVACSLLLPLPWPLPVRLAPPCRGLGSAASGSPDPACCCAEPRDGSGLPCPGHSCLPALSQTESLWLWPSLGSGPGPTWRGAAPGRCLPPLQPEAASCAAHSIRSDCASLRLGPAERSLRSAAGSCAEPRRLCLVCADVLSPCALSATPAAELCRTSAVREATAGQGLLCPRLG